MVDQEALAASIRRMRARTSQRRGHDVQVVVARMLTAMGLLCVEQIHTGFKKVGGRFVPCERVSGDIRAVAPGGRSVLIEVKHRPDRLAFAALERHQVDALTRHHQCGGLSLLAWSDGATIHIMAWPVGPLVSGASITPEQAEAAAWRQGRA